jgi:defect-in-organelle-trafficking protein DotB
MNIIELLKSKEGLNKSLVLLAISILPYKNTNFDLREETNKRKSLLSNLSSSTEDSVYSNINKILEMEDNPHYESYNKSKVVFTSPDLLVDFYLGLKLANELRECFNSVEFDLFVRDNLNFLNDNLKINCEQKFIENIINPEESFQDKIIYRTNKATFDGSDLENILEHAYKIKASDIHIQTNEFIKVDIHSRFYPLTNRPLNANEVETFIKRIYGDNAVTEMNQKRAIDKSMFIRLQDSDKMIRFRINAVGELSKGMEGIQITIRTIDSTPPTLAALKVEQNIIDNLVPTQGIIIITGPTGSGKSTLLAANIRNIIENPDREQSKKIVTYEAPIEFVYDEINKYNNIISQTEIGTHLKTWDDAIESAMRRKPNIILIGESRDPETIRNSILASQTGHLLYTTAHTNGVAETVRRMINVFSPEERSALQYDLIESLKMIISQRLLKTIDGKRIAIREYLIFTDEIKDRLLSTDPNLMTRELRLIVKEKEQTLIHDAKRKYEEGIISENEYMDAKRSFGGAL